MHLTTPVHIAHARQEIDYTKRILLIGSCFADNIADKLKAHYFQVTANPFGTLYNPLSIARCLEILAHNDETALSEHIIQHNGLYHSFLHHGSFSCADKELFANGLSESLKQGTKALQEADTLIITFGTAWIYEYGGKVVSNCHKLPSNAFTRRRLNVQEIANTYRRLLELPLFRDKQIIFTVSPIRHMKDGLHENQISKSTLLLAVDELDGDYFPSYEIMMDELRDYRFYADDMLHPSAIAVDYIWERFAKTYFSEETQREMQPLHQLYLDLQHRPLHTDSDSYQAFAKATQEKRAKLRERYPWI